MTVMAADIDGPVYMRFSREKSPIMTTEETPFEKKIQVFWISDDPQCTIFATGHMVFQAMLAAKELESEGINVKVASVTSIKPLDDATVLGLSRETGCIVTAEDHQVMGGLGGAIAELLARKHPTPMEFVGLQNTFAESGSPKDIMKKFGMDSDAIKEAVKKAITRK